MGHHIAHYHLVAPLPQPPQGGLRLPGAVDGDIARERESNTVIMDAKGELCYSVKERPEERQLELLRKRIPDSPSSIRGW